MHSEDEMCLCKENNIWVQVLIQFIYHLYFRVLHFSKNISNIKTFFFQNLSFKSNLSQHVFIALSFITAGKGLKSNQVKNTSALSTTSKVTRFTVCKSSGSSTYRHSCELTAVCPLFFINDNMFEMIIFYNKPRMMFSGSWSQHCQCFTTNARLSVCTQV